jgi:hypothetical protein
MQGLLLFYEASVAHLAYLVSTPSAAFAALRGHMSGHITPSLLYHVLDAPHMMPQQLLVSLAACQCFSTSCMHGCDMLQPKDTGYNSTPALALFALCRQKYGRSYDVSLVQRSYLGKVGDGSTGLLGCSNSSNSSSSSSLTCSDGKAPRLQICWSTYTSPQPLLQGHAGCANSDCLVTCLYGGRRTSCRAPVQVYAVM